MEDEEFEQSPTVTNPKLLPANLAPQITMPDVLASALQSEQILGYTQNIRKMLVDNLVGSGQLPQESSDKNALLTLLKDMDAQEINKKRLVVEQKNGEANSAAVAEVLKALDPRTAFRYPAGQPGSPVVDVESRVLSDNVEKPVILPGEGDVNPEQMTYEAFMRNNGVDPDTVGRTFEGADTEAVPEETLGREQDTWPGMEDY